MKKIRYVILSLIAIVVGMMVFPQRCHADTEWVEVETYDEFRECLSKTAETSTIKNIRLTKDIESKPAAESYGRNNLMVVQGNCTVDLNGHDIKINNGDTFYVFDELNLQNNVLSESKIEYSSNDSASTVFYVMPGGLLRVGKVGDSGTSESVWDNISIVNKSDKSGESYNTKLCFDVHGKTEDKLIGYKEICEIYAANGTDTHPSEVQIFDGKIGGRDFSASMSHYAIYSEQYSNNQFYGGFLYNNMKINGSTYAERLHFRTPSYKDSKGGNALFGANFVKPSGSNEYVNEKRVTNYGSSPRKWTECKKYDITPIKTDKGGNIEKTTIYLYTNIESKECFEISTKPMFFCTNKDVELLVYNLQDSYTAGEDYKFTITTIPCSGVSASKLNIYHADETLSIGSLETLYSLNDTLTYAMECKCADYGAKITSTQFGATFEENDSHIYKLGECSIWERCCGAAKTKAYIQYYEDVPGNSWTKNCNSEDITDLIKLDGTTSEIKISQIENTGLYKCRVYVEFQGKGHKSWYSDACSLRINSKSGADAYSLYVGGRQVKKSNKNDIFADGGSARFAEITRAGKTFWYLYLNNCDLSGYVSSDNNWYGIYSNNSNAYSLNIVLSGENSITAPNGSSAVNYYGIYNAESAGNLMISGDGSLTITTKQGTSNAVKNCGIFSAVDVYIENTGSLEINAGTNRLNSDGSGYGILLENGKKINIGSGNSRPRITVKSTKAAFSNGEGSNAIDSGLFNSSLFNIALEKSNDSPYAFYSMTSKTGENNTQLWKLIDLTSVSDDSTAPDGEAIDGKCMRIIPAVNNIKYTVTNAEEDNEYYPVNRTISWDPIEGAASYTLTLIPRYDTYNDSTNSRFYFDSSVDTIDAASKREYYCDNYLDFNSFYGMTKEYSGWSVWYGERDDGKRGFMNDNYLSNWKIPISNITSCSYTLTDSDMYWYWNQDRYYDHTYGKSVKFLPIILAYDKDGNPMTCESVTPAEGNEIKEATAKIRFSDKALAKAKQCDIKLVINTEPRWTTDCCETGWSIQAFYEPIEGRVERMTVEIIGSGNIPGRLLNNTRGVPKGSGYSDNSGSIKFVPKALDETSDIIIDVSTVLDTTKVSINESKFKDGDLEIGTVSLSKTEDIYESYSVKYGSDVKFYVTPKEGYCLSNLYVNKNQVNGSTGVEEAFGRISYEAIDVDEATGAGEYSFKMIGANPGSFYTASIIPTFQKITLSAKASNENVHFDQRYNYSKHVNKNAGDDVNIIANATDDVNGLADAVFANWSFKDKDGVDITDEIVFNLPEENPLKAQEATFVMPEKDVTVIANYAHVHTDSDDNGYCDVCGEKTGKSHNVSLNVNDSSMGSVTANFTTNVEENTTIILKAVAYEGYRFKEWQSADVSISNDSFKMPYNDVSVTAVFEARQNNPEPVTFTVTFDTDGGSDVAPVTVEEGALLTTPNEPAKSDYVFAGWYLDKACTYTYHFNDRVTKDLTLFARWKKNGRHPFADVADDKWYTQAVQYAWEYEIMNGLSDNEFGPNNECTREMLVTILHNSERKAPSSGYCPFDDVQHKWYYDAVCWAYETKVTSGQSETKFGTGKNLTRQEVAGLLYNYTKIKGWDVTNKKELTEYADVSEVSGWAMEMMKWANANGIINGKKIDGTYLLDPKGEATRAEIAQIIMNYRNKFVEQ